MQVEARAQVEARVQVEARARPGTVSPLPARLLAWCTAAMCVAGMITDQLKHLRQASYDARDMHVSDWDRRDMQHFAPIEVEGDETAAEATSKWASSTLALAHTSSH